MGVFGGLLLIIGVVLFFVNPRFRKVILWVAGGLAAIIGIYVLNSQEKKRESLSLISAQELLIADLRMSSGYGSNITGTVKNLSPKYTLQNLTLIVHAFDCPDDFIDGRCAAIGEANASDYVTVPPGQVRQLSASAFFSNMPKVKNHFVWRYDIGEIRAKLD